MSLSRWSLPAVLLVSVTGGSLYLVSLLEVGNRSSRDPDVRGREDVASRARTAIRRTASATTGVVRVREVSPPLPASLESSEPGGAEEAPALDPHERAHQLLDTMREGIPDARSLCADTVANPQGIELAPGMLDELDVALRTLGRQDQELRLMQSEIIERSIQDKISRGQTLPLDDTSEAFHVPPGAVGFSRIEKGKSSFRVLLHRGEFPALDGVLASRDELVHRAVQLVNSYLLP